MTHTTGFDLPNLLLGLAWLGELDRQQIQQLWFAGRSVSTVEKTLARLRKEELITVRGWSVRDEQRGVTVPQLGRWSLTPTGHALIKTSDQYPRQPARPRQQRLIAHDARTTAIIVRLIELGRRHGLSGIFVAHELRLNPQERRPVCDALVVLQFGDFQRPNLVPWSSDSAIDDEGRVRFAIEADNDTEPLAVIKAKGYAYRRLHEDDHWASWWTGQYGPLPLPLWVAPSQERAEAIHTQWKRAWPAGQWFVTSDSGIEQNRLVHWQHGREEMISLGFHKRRSALPAAPVAALPAPAKTQHHGPAEPPVSTTPQATIVTAPDQRPLAVESTPASPLMPAAPTPVIAPLTAPTISFIPAGTRIVVPFEAAYTTSGQCDRPPGRFARIWAALWWLWPLLLMVPRGLWRGGSAVYRWYHELDYETVAIAWRVALAITLVAGSLYLWVGKPAWLFDPLRQVMPTAQPTAVATATIHDDAPTLTSVCVAAHVAAERVNLRAEPGLQGQIVRKLRRDERLTVLDCVGHERDGYRWWQVVGEDGLVGWVATKWLET